MISSFTDEQSQNSVSQLTDFELAEVYKLIENYKSVVRDNKLETLGI
jgi:hypothetical protein